MEWNRPRRRAAVSIIVVTLGVAGCSSGSFNDSAFNPNEGQLTGLHEGHLGCLGLRPDQSKQVDPVALTHGYTVRTNPLRIVDQDGHEVARVGEVVSVSTEGEGRRQHGCGRGRQVIMLEGSSIKVLSVTPTASG